MKRFRWQLLIIFLTGLVVGILLLGEQPKPTVLLATPEPNQGGVYTEGLIGQLQRMNPLLDFYNPVDREVDRLLYSGILRFDGQGQPQADLADSWGVSKDGTIYNFSLRPGVTWHDGEPLTSEDILFTIELMREGSGVLPEDLVKFWQEVDVKVLSDNTLQFRLPEPFAPFLDYLTFGVLPSHLLSGLSLNDLVDDPFNLQPVGSGPFAFSKLLVDDGQITGVVLQANPRYYQKEPYLDQIVFRHFPDGATALQAYRDGKIQGIGRVSTDILPEVLREEGLSVYTGREPELSMVLFNLNNPKVAFFQEQEVRLALMTGINRQWIVDRILMGQAIQADGPILPGVWAYYDGLKHVEFDSQAAVNMLRDAEYILPAEGDPIRKKGDQSLSFTLIYPNDQLHSDIARSIQRDWAALNIQVQLESLSYDVLVNERLVNREYEAALIDLNLSRSPDPDPYPFWDQAQATGGQNYSQWDDRAASDFLEQARITVNQEERARLYRNFQVVFQKEIPAIPLYYPVYTYAVDKAVQGIRMGPLFDSSDRFATIMNWFLTSTRINIEPGITPTIP
jgi:peptide/nickel transport system substrate-binding protein